MLPQDKGNVEEYDNMNLQMYGLILLIENGNIGLLYEALEIFSSSRYTENNC